MWEPPQGRAAAGPGAQQMPARAAVLLLLGLPAAGATVPTVEIAPGVHMPQVSQGLARGCPPPPELVIADLKLGLEVGFTSFDTAAFDPCYNDTAVGLPAALFPAPLPVLLRVPPSAVSQCGDPAC